MDFRKRQQRPYTPLMISGTPVERVSSFKYPSVNISEDLTWTTHIQTQVKKARQRLYHLQTADEMQGLTSNPENFIFRGHRKYINSVHLSMVSTVYCPAHFILLHILFLFLFVFFFFYKKNVTPIFMYILFIYIYKVFVLHIIALSMERTWLTFHCWLYSV